jgi:hypothetical protein
MRANRVVLTLLAMCTTLCVLTPAVAQAQPVNPCTLADFGLPGEASQFNPVASGDSVYLKTRLKAGRSYVGLAWAPIGGGPLGEDSADLSIDYFTDDTCTTAAATVAVLPATAEPSLIVAGHAGAQVSIIPTTTGTFYIRIHNNAPTQTLLKTMIFETTIFSPWWFTGGTNQAYVEVRNNSSHTVAAQLTAFRPDGTVCGTSNLSIAGDGNAAVDIGALGTCRAAVSGSAQLAFQGMPGGLTANITTIDVTSGTSFDSPFTPRMVWSMLNR